MRRSIVQRRAMTDRAGRSTPRPLDLRVPSSISVVAITGPNTGGKTVALKAAGLAVLFSKAGLFIPVGSRDEPVSLSYFDAVLADIGDAQSLQQSLSTFSGHIRRIDGILSTATKHSLVLLDEVGSGTDPVEGAALARAILERLADQSGLCLATTHHSEIKEIDKEDDRFVNASMEFDVSTLSPTYRLIWGQSGASNALDIASALGFDPSILREARSVAKEAAQRQRNQPLHMEAVAKSLERQLELAEIDLQLIRRKREAAEQKALQIREEIEQVQRLKEKVDASPKLITKEVRAYSDRLQEAIDKYGGGSITNEELEAVFAKLEANIQPLISQFKGQDISSGEDGPIKRGDVVFVAKLQGEAVVESIDSLGSVVVRPKDPKLAMASIMGWGSKSKGQVFKYRRDEVQVIKRAEEGSDVTNN